MCLGCMGDTEFHFRIRCSPQTAGSTAACRKLELEVPQGFRVRHITQKIIIAKIVASRRRGPRGSSSFHKSIFNVQHSIHV